MKYERIKQFDEKGMINSNMRCIEMALQREKAHGADGINSNMRCIEIIFQQILIEALIDKQ